MTSISIPAFRLPARFPALLAGLGLFALLVLAAALVAQVAGERGIAPVVNSTDIEVAGIEVNVTGDNPEDAREKGWRLAQRLAWEKLKGPDIPDSRIESLVSAIVIEEETLGPRRYIAKLGVIFDRTRAGALLGADGERPRSAPMLTLPVLVTGGTRTMYEVRNPWQRAWAEEQTGSSAIDYVRPTGAGGDSLLLTAGQVGRRRVGPVLDTDHPQKPGRVLPRDLLLRHDCGKTKRRGHEPQSQVRLCADEHVLQRAHLLEQLRILEGPRHAGPYDVSRASTDRLAPFEED